MTVYVVERSALSVSDYDQPAGLSGCGGESGICCVPVVACAREADATEVAVRLTFEAWDWLPALRFSVYDDKTLDALRAAITRHGFVAPHLAPRSGGPTLTLREWWAANAPNIPAALSLELWTLLGEDMPLYRIEARTLED